MPVNEVLVNRYAKAFFNVVGATGDHQSADGDLSKFVMLLGAQPQLFNLIKDPRLPHARRVSLVNELTQALKLNRQVCGLLALLAERRRVHLLPAFMEAYRTIYQEQLGMVAVKVQVVDHLSAGQQQRIINLAQRLTARKPQLEIQQDRRILGGMVLHIGGKVFDASLRTKLAQLRRRMGAS